MLPDWAGNLAQSGNTGGGVTAVLFQSAEKSSAVLELQKCLGKCDLCGRYHITRSIKELSYSKAISFRKKQFVDTFIVTSSLGSLCCTDRVAGRLFNAFLLVTLVDNVTVVLINQAHVGY